MAILLRSRALCWLELLACLLSRDSGRVTGQLKPQMYYSSTHVRYYRRTGWHGEGVACTAAPQGQEVDTDGKNWQVSRLVDRSTGPVSCEASVTVSPNTPPSNLFPCCCSHSKLQDCTLHCKSIKAYNHYFNLSKTSVIFSCPAGPSRATSKL